MFRESEGKKVFETDHLAAAPDDADEVKMNVQRGSGTTDNSGPLSSDNPPFSVAVPKPLSSKMNSRSVMPTKTPSFP